MSEAITIKEIFAKLERGIEKYPDDVRSVDAIYLFQITGEQALTVWVNLKDNPGLAYEERPAECIVKARDKDFLKVYKGIIPGFKAVLSGKLKVSGKLELATRLGEVFEKARGKRSD